MFFCRIKCTVVCTCTVKCKISGQYMKFEIYLNSGECIGISDETKT